MNKQDYRDFFILGVVCVIMLEATVFLFLYPSSVNFATWSGLVATVGGVFHWLCVSDDKRVDAGNVVAVLPAEGLASELRNWKEDRNGRSS